MHLQDVIEYVYESKSKIDRPKIIKNKTKFVDSMIRKRSFTVKSLGTKYFFDGKSVNREFGARSTMTAHRSGYSRRIRSPKDKQKRFVFVSSKEKILLKKTFSTTNFIWIIRFEFPTHNFDFEVEKSRKDVQMIIEESSKSLQKLMFLRSLAIDKSNFPNVRHIFD